MEKARHVKPEAHQEQTHRSSKRAPEKPGLLTGTLPLMNAALQGINPEQLLSLQHQVGNQAMLHRMRTPVQRVPEYNEARNEEGRRIDPEQATGVLPFTPEGWDGRAIASSLAQLNVEAPESDAVRCVQTSFLAGLVLRGPPAVSEMIDNYLRRYRAGLRQASTPENIRQWYQRSIRRLTPIPGRITDQTATFEDLSTMLREMYDVFGTAPGGTFIGPELSMLRREGYTVQDLGGVRVTQAEAAAAAATLLPGEMLACGVDASDLGTGETGHRVHIGAFPDTGELYFYDPWPVRGDQMIELDASLNNIRPWFFNEPGEGPAPEAEMEMEEMTITGEAETETAPETAPETTGAEAETTERGAEETETFEMEPITITGGEAAAEEAVARTFTLDAKYTPPAPTEEVAE